MNPRWSPAALAVSLALGCGGESVEFTPTFTAGPCPVDLGEEAAAIATCGTVQVPRDHENPGAGTIDLAVVRLASLDGFGDMAPLLWLEGGPGSSAISTRLEWMITTVRPTLGVTRDIVIFDPRGTGFSGPVLDCPEVDPRQSGEYDTVNNGVTDLQGRADSLRRCRTSLLIDGVDLWDYNGVWSGIDAAYVGRALGYSQVAYLGSSWGTLTAQRAVAADPGLAAAVILDGVVPGSQNWLVDAPDNADRALRDVLTACENDGNCRRKFPGVAAQLNEVLTSLATSPIELGVVTPDGERRTWYVTPFRFAALLRSLLYSAVGAGTTPRLIAEVSRGETGLLRRLLTAQSSDDGFAAGAYWAAVCADQRHRFDQTRPAETVLETELNAYVEFSRGICETWAERIVNPASLGVLQSDVPTLLMSGEFDPITPAWYASVVATGLTNVHEFVFPGVAHGAIGSDCGRRVAVAFLTNPQTRPADSCFDELEVRFDPGREMFTAADGSYIVPLPVGWSTRTQGPYELRFSDANRAVVGVGVVQTGSVDEGANDMRIDGFTDFVGRRVARSSERIAGREWEQQVWGDADDILFVAGTWQFGKVWTVAIRGPLADVSAEFDVYREAIERFGIVEGG